MKIDLPKSAEKALQILNSHGFEAHVVGGCVRDGLLGKIPLDWDITTNAKPDEMKLCFAGRKIIETGLKHGTLTVMFEDMPIEITTYRIDGEYSDHRHPNKVESTDNLEAVLSRRDFTINALAFHPQKGIIDFFGGQKDIQNRIISCVGDAKTRFSEDALRILRAVRFSSVLGFKIADSAFSAMNQLCAILPNISAERISSELNKTLLGDSVGEVLLENVGIFTAIIPELAPMLGFDQHTKYHHLDLWRHTTEAVRQAPKDLVLRITMLLHDIGKISTFTQDKQGTGHFYGHADKGANMADEILLRLRYDNSTRNQVVYLIKHHCDQLNPDAKQIKRALNRMGEENLRLLIEVKRADCNAKAAGFMREKQTRLNEIEGVISEIIAQNQVFLLRDLKVSGDDLLNIGFNEDKSIGNTLNRLLNLVIDGQLQNDRETLLNRAKDMLGGL